jgi:hypothetical protein
MGGGVAHSGKYNQFPLYEANLTGRGQIIGIADSGLDMIHVFFMIQEYHSS